MKGKMVGLRGPRLWTAAAIALQIFGIASAADLVTTASKSYEPDTTGWILQSSSAPMPIAVSLALRNEAELDAWLVRTQTLGDQEYGKYLSPAEFRQRYAPSDEQAKAVLDYLNSMGFYFTKIAPNNMLVSGVAPPEAIGKTFGMRIKIWKIGGKQVMTNTDPALLVRTYSGSATVPAYLSFVQALLGIQTFDIPKTLNVPAQGRAASLKSYNPTTFPSIYSAVNITSGAGTNIGVIMSGDSGAGGGEPGVIGDLRSFEDLNGLTHVPVVDPFEHPSDGIANTAEWDLDTQSSTAMAGSVAALYLYHANTLADNDLALAYNEAISANAIKALNISLGGCEFSSHQSGAMAADDTIFKSAVAMGITVFVSSGDGGAATGCYGHTGLFRGVSYPASSPYVVAVGGTTLTTSGATWGNETAWSKSGGGVSLYEPAPAWQAATGASHRQVPDIAMDADPNSGAQIIVNGAQAIYGGTSLSAPLAMGAWARIQTSHGNTLGFAAPLLYQAAKSPPLPYHDIVSGSNGAGLLGLGGFRAVAGYDEVTGLGSLKIDALNVVLGN